MKSQYGNLKSVEVKSQFLLKIEKKVDVNVKTQRSWIGDKSERHRLKIFP